ncbi:MAG: hypothetical protein IJ298_11430 [Ruminococcus sp.]|nr:hypothetical protein [Ruminococcus sp.]
MSKFSEEQTDKMLRTYHACMPDTYSFRKPRKTHLTSVIAACIAILLIAGVCFIPGALSHSDSGFIIVANAQALDEAGIASADEITSDAFVEIKSDSYPIVTFDFDCILDPDAKEYDLTQKYLFHAVTMNLDFDVVGEDIETVTYKTNKGVFVLSYSPEGKDSQCIFAGYDSPTTEYTIDYQERDNYRFSFNPVYDDSYTYDFITKYYSYAYANPEQNYSHSFCDTDELVYSEDSGDLHAKYGWVSSIGSGYRSSAPTAATEEEINALRAYAKADDMVGFFNCQNKIFERIINEVTIDITVTKTDGSVHTKTLELCYTPDEITSAEGYLDDQTRTYSTGTISAKLK